MGFFQTLKEKLTGKKAEQPALPTLDSINQQNADLTKKEETVVEAVVNSPASSLTTQANVLESIGPNPDPVVLSTLSSAPATTDAQTVPAPAPKKAVKKTAKKAAKKKAAPKKAVKKSAAKKVSKPAKKAKSKPAKKAGKKKKK